MRLKKGGGMKTNNTPQLEVAQIFRQNPNVFDNISYDQKKVVQNILNCRTEALGGHTLECNECGHKEQSYNSCRDRHCPKCQSTAKLKWLLKRKEELLPVTYYHLVFTVPWELNTLFLQNKVVLYNLLFKSVSETLKEAALNPDNLGARIGFFMVLHTWGQKLMEHPHIHAVIPGGGLSLDKKSWVDAKENYFLPVKILSSLFRGKFMNKLNNAFCNKKLELHGQIAKLGEKSEFKKLVDTCYQKSWVVYAKKPFGGPEKALEYLGRYTHRIAISNNRIKKIEDGKVHFDYRDYKDQNKNKVLVLSIEEFTRRFLLHVLPKGFVKIRHVGIFSHRFKQENLDLCRELLKDRSPDQEDQREFLEKSTKELILTFMGIDIEQCPKCKKGTMIKVGEIKSPSKKPGGPPGS